jgi:hypothetical protein
VSDVFISYSQPDAECAHEILARLEAQDVKCWIAPRDITPSADWAEEIINAISAARVMVLVFSANSNQSPQVRREVERAVHKHVSILPFRIEDVLPSKSLEFFLSAQHWLDAFSPPRESHYQRLCNYVKAQLAPPLRAHTGEGGHIASKGPQSSSVGGHRFAAEVLLHVETQLADFIGPVAKHLVARAAARANDIEDLIACLLPELDAQPDRRTFAERCRHPVRGRGSQISGKSIGQKSSS